MKKIVAILLLGFAVTAAYGIVNVDWRNYGVVYFSADPSVGILGPSGSGKSTIVQLMYSPDNVKDDIKTNRVGAVNDVIWQSITITENGDGLTEWAYFTAMNYQRAFTNGYVYALIFQDNNVQPADWYYSTPLLPLQDVAASAPQVIEMTDPVTTTIVIDGPKSAQVIGGSRTLTVNGGSGSGVYAYGEQAAIFADTVAHAIFARWTGATQYVANATSANTTVTMPAQSITVTATYIYVNYTLTVNGGTGSGTNYIYAQVVPVSATTPIGKTFVQWIGDTQYVASVTSANTTVTMPSSNITLTATYSNLNYSLTVAGGTGSGTNYNYMQAVPISANLPAQAVFVRWTGATQYVASVTSANTTVTMPTSNIAVTSTYANISFIAPVIREITNGIIPGKYEPGETITITVNSTNSGMVNVSNITNTLSAPSYFSITPPSATYSLAARQTNATVYTVVISNTTPAGNYTFNVTNQSGSMIWKDSFTLSVGVLTLTVNGGTGSGTNYIYTQVVPILATNPVGKTFVQWTGDTQYVASVTSANTTVTMPSSNITLTATYSNLNYSLTVAGGSGSGTNYIYTQTVPISASNAAIGKAFAQWIGATQYVASVTSANTTVTMPAQAVSLTATYKDVYYTLTVQNGSGSGTYTYQQQMGIAAMPPPPWIRFASWIGDTQCVNSVTTQQAIVTMPASNIILTATFTNLYSTNADNTITLTGDSSTNSVIFIPDTISGKTVTRIANLAFYRNSTAKYITVPAAVTNIGTRAFSECTNLVGVYFLGNSPVLGANAFLGSTNVTVYYYPGATGWSTNYGERSAVLLPYDYSMADEQVAITAYLGTGPSVVIPSIINGLPVTEIADWSFNYIGTLTNVMIPGSVAWVGEWAFADCVNLSRVTVGGGVVWIGDNAFYNTPALSGIYFDGSAPVYGSEVFGESDNTTIYRWASGVSGWPAVGSLWAGRPTAYRDQVLITALSAAQRSGTKLVDIVYNLAASGTNAVPISLSMQNAGVPIAATNLYGDVGVGVTTGSNKAVVWNAGSDWNGNAADLLCFVSYATAPQSFASNRVSVDTRDYKLTVQSDCGSPVPPRGTNTYAWGSVVTCSVPQSASSGGTLWQNIGWTGSGSVPASGGSNTAGAITLTALNSTITWLWQTTEQFGLEHLETFFYGERNPADVNAADSRFQEAVAANPQDYESRVYAAFTKILNLINDPALTNLMGQFGFNFTDTVTNGWNLSGNFNFNAPAVNSAADTFWAGSRPQIDAAYNLLDGIPTNWTGSAEVSTNYFPVDTTVYIDYADVAAAKAVLKALRSFGNVARAYDLPLNYKAFTWPVTMPTNAAITVDGNPSDWNGVPVQLAGATNSPVSKAKACRSGNTVYLLIETTGLNLNSIYSMWLNGSIKVKVDGADSSLDWSCYRTSGWSNMYCSVSGTNGNGSFVVAGNCIEASFVLPQTVNLTEGGIINNLQMGWNQSWPTWYYGSAGLKFPDNYPANDLLALIPDAAKIIRNASALTESKSDLLSALNLAQTAAPLIKNRMDIEPHFLEYDPTNAVAYDELVKYIADVKASLSSEQVFTSGLYSVHAYLGAVFDPPYLTRSMLPAFAAGALLDNPVQGSFPDPTFGGIFPYLTQPDITAMLNRCGFTEQAFGYRMGASNTVTITKQRGSDGHVTIPSDIAGSPVTAVADDAFSGRVGLTNVVFGTNITTLGSRAFSDCTGLGGLYFYGNAPVLIGADAFKNVPGHIFFHYGTTGWSNNLVGVPAELWRAVIERDNSFGPRPGGFQFGFTLPPGDKAIVEACASLSTGTWTRVYTNVSATGRDTFIDPDWKAAQKKYYRVILLYP